MGKDKGGNKRSGEAQATPPAKEATKAPTGEDRVEYVPAQARKRTIPACAIRGAKPKTAVKGSPCLAARSSPAPVAKGLLTAAGEDSSTPRENIPVPAAVQLLSSEDQGIYRTLFDIRKPGVAVPEDSVGFRRVYAQVTKGPVDLLRAHLKESVAGAPLVRKHSPLESAVAFPDSEPQATPATSNPSRRSADPRLTFQLPLGEETDSPADKEVKTVKSEKSRVERRRENRKEKRADKANQKCASAQLREVSWPKSLARALMAVTKAREARTRNAVSFLVPTRKPVSTILLYNTTSKYLRVILFQFILPVPTFCFCTIGPLTSRTRSCRRQLYGTAGRG